MILQIYRNINHNNLLINNYTATKSTNNDKKKENFELNN